MTLLLKDTSTETDTPQAAAPPEAPPQVRTCPTCHAPLEDGQDWCLNCGEAQPSRRFALPGKRATATVLALTTVLVGGAVAASYAALNDGTETVPTTPTQLAQVPAPDPAAAAAAAAAAEAAAAASSAVPATPSSTVPADTGVLPPDTGSTATPPPSSSSSSSASSSQGTSSSSATATDKDSSSSTDTTADTRTSTTKTTTETAPVAIKLADDAAALYDPYQRDTAAGDPTKAFDGDPNTSFPVTVAAGSTQIGAGLSIDLPKLQGIREIDLTTKTPGFKIEVYATDETDLPPDVLDTRWAHLKDVTGVGADADGKETVALGSGTTKYRHVLLWLTAPPTDGSTVRISELKLLG